MSSENVYKIEDKNFQKYMSTNELEEIVADTAGKINSYYKDLVSEDKPLIMVGVLNGCFMFLRDLMKTINIPCEVHFIKVSSYEGTESSGTITSVLGLTKDIKDQHVLIVEDIVDTGLTISNLMNELNKEGPTTLNICTLLFKYQKYKGDLKIRFIGKTIMNLFVLGYGLDYNYLGRNLDSIYALVDS